MRIIADLHIHSKYSRACSKELTPDNLYLWAKKKGIGLIGTADCLHPKWNQELKDSLQEVKQGLYQIKQGNIAETVYENSEIYFMLTAEVSSIYKQGEKVRRIHNLILAPCFEAVDRLIKALEEQKVNLKADGRPIMGLSAGDLLKICKAVDKNIELVPAHAWTPHFGVFGSLSGFNSLEEAFGDMAKYVFAIETGLSSDPKMNWQVPDLDKLSLISNSDAHSLRKLGREANVFEADENTLSYLEIIKIIKNKNPKEFLRTIEFFPEEGKYHLDGHSDHKFSCKPGETKRLNGICPVCGKKLLKGVLNRVEELGSRKYGFKPNRAIPFVSIIPLEEIIAETFGVGVSSKKVSAMYERMVSFMPEFGLLLEASESQIAKAGLPQIAKSVLRVREGKVNIQPGYDGVFGKIQIFTEKEREKLSTKTRQSQLF